MESIILNLKKQKQLLEIELSQYITAKRSGRRAIHSEMYYSKIKHAHMEITMSIKMLISASEDVYNNFKYLEQ